MRQTIAKMACIGEVDKYIGYGLRRASDGVLVVLDTDRECAAETAAAWIPRIRTLPALDKRVALVFLKSEFESMFLYCLDKIAERYPEYGWDLSGWEAEDDHESVVAAKGALSRRMGRGRAYKETRDQARFVSTLDLARLRRRSRSFRRLEGALLWMRGNHEEDVHPLLGEG